MIGWKALFLTEKEGVYASGGVGGSEYYEFKVGEEYEVEVEPVLCQRGFHFVEENKLAFCLNYYDKPNKTVYAKIEATGKIISEYEKSATNKIKILEVMDKFGVTLKSENKEYSNTGNYNTGDYNAGNYNTGNYNTGDRNTGYRNIGYCNTGDYNAGNYNTGNYNTGYRNTGYYNTGYYNTGDYNTGDYNTGDYNAGYYNTGDYNTGNFNAGYFNRTTPKQIEVFEKMIDREIWDSADKPNILFFTFDTSKTYKENWAEALKQAKIKSNWKGQYALLLALPNFNWEIFTDITGITKEMSEE